MRLGVALGGTRGSPRRAQPEYERRVLVGTRSGPRTLHQGTLNAETSADEVDVSPAQGEELSTAGASSCCQGQIEMEGGVASDELQ